MTDIFSIYGFSGIWHDAGLSVVLGSELSRGDAREFLEVAREERLVGEIHGNGY